MADPPTHRDSFACNPLQRRLGPFATSTKTEVLSPGQWAQSLQSHYSHEAFLHNQSQHVALADYPPTYSR